MIREYVLLFKENADWGAIIKYLGKDFVPLENSREDIMLDAGGEKGDCHINVYRQAGLVVNGNNRIRIVYDEGIMTAGGQETKICEMHISRFSGRHIDCIKLAVKLAKKYDIILESRTHEQRAADLSSGIEFGRAHMKSFAPQRVGDALYDLMWWHLCGISQAGGEFVLRPDERLPLRRLRVEIRKLRAMMTVLDEVLVAEAGKWQEKLRSLTIKLARSRELDVALSNWRRTGSQRRRYNRDNDGLMSFMRKERGSEIEKIEPVFKLKNFTPFLLEFMLWILSDPVKEDQEDLLLEKVIDRRIWRWYKKMTKLVREHPDFANDEKAHEVRIKAKAIRYVLQSISGQAYGDDSKVLRHLKRLQDALGVLHDNYINEELARSIALKKQTDNVLAYQAGMFAGSERAQTMAVRRLLPGLWEKFIDEWEKCYG